MISKRPININPLSIRLPIPAWVSISHRLSGVAIFILIPVLLYAFQLSMASEASFNALADFFAQPWIKGLLWIFGASLVFHLLAGIRHLLMDLHLGESLQAGRMTAWAVIVLFVSLLIVAAFYFCGR